MFWISRSFDLGDLGVLEKSPVNIFNDIIFEISLFNWSKCTIECAIRLTLILKSAQARCVLYTPWSSHNFQTFGIKSQSLGKLQWRSNCKFKQLFWTLRNSFFHKLYISPLTSHFLSSKAFFRKKLFLARGKRIKLQKSNVALVYWTLFWLVMDRF